MKEIMLKIQELIHTAEIRIKELDTKIGAVEQIKLENEKIFHQLKAGQSDIKQREKKCKDIEDIENTRISLELASGKLSAEREKFNAEKSKLRIEHNDLLQHIETEHQLITKKQLSIDAQIIELEKKKANFKAEVLKKIAEEAKKERK